jgi:hypothetical protein
MKFKGRIFKVLDKRSGVSQRTGNEWVSQEFIFEYFENPTDRYSDRVVLGTMDADYIDKIKEGAEVTINFGHNVREYQGRYFNSLRVFNMEFAGDAPQQPAAAAPANVAPSPQPQAQGKDDDDLPF